MANSINYLSLGQPMDNGHTRSTANSAIPTNHYADTQQTRSAGSPPHPGERHRRRGGRFSWNASLAGRGPPLLSDDDSDASKATVQNDFSSRPHTLTHFSHQSRATGTRSHQSLPPVSLTRPSGSERTDNQAHSPHRSPPLPHRLPLSPHCSPPSPHRSPHRSPHPPQRNNKGNPISESFLSSVTHQPHRRNRTTSSITHEVMRRIFTNRRRDDQGERSPVRGPASTAGRLHSLREREFDEGDEVSERKYHTDPGEMLRSFGGGRGVESLHSSIATPHSFGQPHHSSFTQPQYIEELHRYKPHSSRSPHSPYSLHSPHSPLTGRQRTTGGIMSGGEGRLNLERGGDGNHLTNFNRVREVGDMTHLTHLNRQGNSAGGVTHKRVNRMSEVGVRGAVLSVKGYPHSVKCSREWCSTVFCCR
eukprot:GHVN01090419.1.p1 GENE.GHVN01090419.1~~GHVN01090419.1.p1  ORF type:complete len:476 (-),score=226.36 GHVN01090419.1:230-1486(-)